MSFSSDDELDKQEKETREILEKRDEIQAYIAENQKLPDDIRLFLTTSKNKEGINIKNADIKTMYIETHSQIDAIQMAGRVRAGLDQLYIVTDAVQNSAPESPFEYELSGRADLKARYRRGGSVVCTGARRNQELYRVHPKEIPTFLLRLFCRYVLPLFGQAQQPEILC